MHHLPTATQPWAIVEIPAEFDPNTRRGLIEAAYRSSARGVVGLVLRGVSRQSVDRLLNDVVSTRVPDLKGVVYLDSEDEGRLFATAARAHVVVAATSGFRSRLVEHGIVPLDSNEADAFLNASLVPATRAIPA